MIFEAPWTLTTDHPASSYGMPVFVHEGIAHGPRDKISAFRVADIINEWAAEPDRTDAEKSLAGRFLRQWPDGPQLARVPGVRGQPQRFAKTTAVTVRIEDSDLERVPKTAKGTPDQDWFRAAIKDKLGRDRL